jgi:hypothetical protein
MTKENNEPQVIHFVEQIDSGSTVQKGESGNLRESKKESKPQGLVRPKGVVVPQVPVKNSEGGSNQK